MKRLSTYAVAQRVLQEYDPENMGRKSLSVADDGQSWRLELSTGGMADNEEWLERACTFDLHKQALWMWWTLCWQSSHRGGLHVFEGRMDQEVFG